MKRIGIVVTLVLVSGLPALAAGCGSSSKSVNPTGTPTKQEVVSFVNEAVAYGKANGKDKAVAEFNNPKGKFVRGELYVYAYNWNGIALANGGNPKLVGRNLIDMTDPNGVKVIQDLMKAAKSGGGWVSYLWPYPETKINEPKLGYAQKVDDNWWLGSGMYEQKPPGK